MHLPDLTSIKTFLLPNSKTTITKAVILSDLLDDKKQSEVEEP